MLSILDNSLRALNFAFLVIILGLTGSLAATHKTHNNPQVNFAIFTAAFGLLFDSLYAIPANFVSALAWPLLIAVFDFLNFVFTFAAATALAVAIRTHSCTNQDYLDSNTVTQGSTDRCRKAQASVAFLYFSFFIFLAKLGLSLVNLISVGAFGAGSSRRTGNVGVPTISQV
ncbi:MARVEL domain-containing protein [Lachancea thermotolerans]|uniref:KLTH0F14850p n=1 Tax=Lachancea thermotolerans (strain ATCC 56472 / CBS 6340 / NRRL Y-8284) TaxID=559295 RepID=C5DJA5_LACTC|nr:KLTH0F14850p [Lachancea thermotolerans CBS 6340]CAR24394.1 KLTH0F14850p [Lachancea thermotolerans CBS 6340]